MKARILFLLLALMVAGLSTTATVSAASTRGDTAGSAIKVSLNGSKTVVVGERSEVWFSFRASKTGVVNVNTFVSEYDTVLNVSSGSPDNLTYIGGNDDAGGWSGANSSLTFTAQKGTVYFFQVTHFFGGWPTVGTTLTLNVASVA
jgi:hypothetical protein